VEFFTLGTLSIDLVVAFVGYALAKRVRLNLAWEGSRESTTEIVAA
jgi:hypothetical protein